MNKEALGVDVAFCFIQVLAWGVLFQVSLYLSYAIHHVASANDFYFS